MAEQNDELQQAREKVAMLERRDAIGKRRTELQRELDALNSEEQSLGKAAPQPGSVVPGAKG